MFKNFATIKTALTSKKWKSLTKKDRIELIMRELKNKNLENFEVFDAPDDGRIVFKVLESIPSNKRGLMLLDIEEQLKTNIDKGLTVWLEPIGDKSKLRNLRGITVN
jgi:hypothetical protein|tara:strand:+ start:1980 stop:2300 length:321 start_codon:yes stop_codon:yes gene_type:complete